MKKIIHYINRIACTLSGIALATQLNTANGANPYLPLWEYIPDGEPYVFEDPDNTASTCTAPMTH